MRCGHLSPIVPELSPTRQLPSSNFRADGGSSGMRLADQENLHRVGGHFGNGGSGN
jgi:hypothetical protein